MKLLNILAWVITWAITIAFVKYLGVKGFIGFLTGIIIATCFTIMIALKYSTQFFTAAEMFANVIIKKGSKNGKTTRNK